MARVLCIDDDLDCLAVMRLFLKKAGHEVLTLNDSCKAIDTILEYQPELMIIDIMMPGVSGGYIYQAIRKDISTTVPIIICTGTHVRIKGVVDPLLVYCMKPFTYDILIEAVNNMLSKPV